MYELNLNDMLAALPDDEWRGFVGQIVQYNEVIFDTAIGTLTDKEIAHAAWEGFEGGLERYPFTMILAGTETFMDHPSIISNVLTEGFSPFFAWLTSGVITATGSSVREQTILRNVHHFISYLLMTGEIPTAEVQRLIHAEFVALDFDGETAWLSKFFNGLQTSLAEVYVIEGYFKARLN